MLYPRENYSQYNSNPFSFWQFPFFFGEKNLKVIFVSVNIYTHILTRNPILWSINFKTFLFLMYWTRHSEHPHLDLDRKNSMLIDLTMYILIFRLQFNHSIRANLAIPTHTFFLSHSAFFCIDFVFHFYTWIECRYVYQWCAGLAFFYKRNLTSITNIWGTTFLGKPHHTVFLILFFYMNYFRNFVSYYFFFQFTLRTLFVSTLSKGNGDNKTNALNL